MYLSGDITFFCKIIWWKRLLRIKSLVLVGIELRPSSSDAHLLQLTTTLKKSGRTSVGLTPHAAKLSKWCGEQNFNEWPFRRIIKRRDFLRWCNNGKWCNISNTQVIFIHRKLWKVGYSCHNIRFTFCSEEQYRTLFGQNKNRTNLSTKGSGSFLFNFRETKKIYTAAETENDMVIQIWWCYSFQLILMLRFSDSLFWSPCFFILADFFSSKMTFSFFFQETWYEFL